MGLVALFNLMRYSWVALYFLEHHCTLWTQKYQIKISGLLYPKILKLEKFDFGLWPIIKVNSNIVVSWKKICHIEVNLK